MPRTRRSRVIDAPVEETWAVVADPYHLPRWWPRVDRVESVAAERWTKVLVSAKGKALRSDERLTETQPPHLRAWTQELEDSPFERLFRELTTTVELSSANGGTLVTIELDQRLRGINRLGGPLVRRGARRLLDEALDGLERACGHR